MTGHKVGSFHLGPFRLTHASDLGHHHHHHHDYAPVQITLSGCHRNDITVAARASFLSHRDTGDTCLKHRPGVRCTRNGISGLQLARNPRYWR